MRKYGIPLEVKSELLKEYAQAFNDPEINKEGIVKALAAKYDISYASAHTIINAYGQYTYAYQEPVDKGVNP